jgi:hypothetical protein
LVKQIGEHQNVWDEYLDPVLFGIRTSIQESTKYTPFYLMHGREARFPYEAEKLVLTKPGDVQERIDEITKFPSAKENINN